MRRNLLVCLSVGTFVVVAGCMRPSSDARLRRSPLAVRFVIPQQEGAEAYAATDLERYSYAATTAGAWQHDGAAATAGAWQHHANADAQSPSHAGLVSEAMQPTAVHHVALWGNGYDGSDVTHAAAELPPGDYTFAFFDPQNRAAMQGWLEVNHDQGDLVELLRRWKSDIAQYKKNLAFSFQAHGNLVSANNEAFTDFRADIKSFERMEWRIDLLIRHELQRRRWNPEGKNELVRNSQLLLLPGQDDYFHPTTQPAFSDADLSQVRSGNSVTKLVVAVDFADAEWRLRQVNQIYGDLKRCRSVFAEEVDRLQRRKQYYTITEHLFHHDRKFVENEAQIALAGGFMDRLDDQMGEIRQHRLALAYLTQLASPQYVDRLFDEERDDLMREHAVLGTRMHRYDLLCTEADETGSQRVSLERDRQQTDREFDLVTNRLEELAESRLALAALRDTAEILHRQNDGQLLAASTLDAGLPFPLREAIERQALMTVRLQNAPNLFAPSSHTVTRAQTVSAPVDLGR